MYGEQRRDHATRTGNNMMDEFRILVDSDYWHYLPYQTRENILTMLGEHNWLGYMHQQHERGLWADTPPEKKDCS